MAFVQVALPVLCTSGPFVASSTSRKSELGTRFFGRRTPSKTNGTRVFVAEGLDVQMAIGSKKVLLVNTESGGHTFIGDYLVRDLINAGHDVTVFKKGKKPATRILPFQTTVEYQKIVSALNVVTGDPSNAQELMDHLGSKRFDVVIDNNGKDVPETEALVQATKHSNPHFVYVSSAGMYKSTDQMPHIEGDPVDVKSGKFLTEQMLAKSGLPFTHLRPVYVFGPLNYRDVENWFFDRIASGRVVPIPGTGAQITNLGHVEDMCSAISAVIDKPEISAGKIYNVSGRKYCTLDALARLCGEAVGVEAQIVHYDPKKFSFGKGKAFPLRDKHFYVSTDKLVRELDWFSAHGLVDGLSESYLYYKTAGRPKNVDFSIDDQILNALSATV